MLAHSAALFSPIYLSIRRSEDPKDIASGENLKHVRSNAAQKPLTPLRRGERVRESTKDRSPAASPQNDNVTVGWTLNIRNERFSRRHPPNGYGRSRTQRGKHVYTIRGSAFTEEQKKAN